MKPKPTFRWANLSWGRFSHCFDEAGQRVGGVRVGKQVYVASCILWTDKREYHTEAEAKRAIEDALEKLYAD